MKIIRGRLSPADVSNPSYRYDADCDCVQYSPDGGTTWQDAPGNDPRHAPQFLKPPVSGSDKRCNAAANMVKWLHDFMDKIIDAMTEGATVLFVVNTLLDFVDLLFPGAVLLQLILDVAGGIFTLGAPLLSDAFAGDTYPLLLCIFDCNEDSDGQVDPTQLATIETAITAQLNTTAALVVNLILSIQGEIGLSNAGSIGGETGDCSACDCCETCSPVDLTASDLCWENIRGTWVMGSGLQSTFSTNPTQLNDVAVADVDAPPSTTVTEVSFNWSASAVGDGALTIIDGVSGGVATELARSTISAGSGTASVSGSFNYDVYRCVLVTSQFDSGTFPGFISEISLTCAP